MKTEVETRDLLSGLLAVQPAIGEPGRSRGEYQLGGVCLQLDRDALLLTASDRVRLHHVRVSRLSTNHLVWGIDEKRPIAPWRWPRSLERKGLADLVTMLRRRKRDTVSVAFNEVVMEFSVGDECVPVTLMDGEYPKYECAIPKPAAPDAAGFWLRIDDPVAFREELRPLKGRKQVKFETNGDGMRAEGVDIASASFCRGGGERASGPFNPQTLIDMARMLGREPICGHAADFVYRFTTAAEARSAEPSRVAAIFSRE
jgi:hypothetical protein